MLEINDSVYGKVEITEPVLIELINSKPLQRLKGIMQAGARVYIFSNRNVTRYEHSVGVMLLLRRLGASIEEQIAGLLHDVPHTAFSHVIDWVFPSKDYAFHEKFHERIIMQSEIPEILKRYGFEVEDFLDEENFPLLERSAPDLCADRIDYTFRDTYSYMYTKEKLGTLIESLIVYDNEIIFSNKKAAYEFAKLYLELDEKEWTRIEGVASYHILAQALKVALNEKMISMDDLFQDDNFVYNKLKNSGNEKIKEKLAKLNPNLKLKDDPKHHDFKSKGKARVVDSKFLDEKGMVRKVTDVFPEFKNKIKQHKEMVEKGYHIKIVSW